MAIFREFNPIDHDRAAEDRRRHRQLIQDSIKKNLSDILSEESIIGESKNKKVKITIRGLKEYQFIYGKNAPGAGSGNGSEKRGDKVGSDDSDQKGQGNKGAGNAEGEDIYETELTIEDIVNCLFEDLNLPFLDKKKLSEVLSEHSRKKSGYQRKGIPPRLAKKRTVVEKIKRKQGMIRALKEEKIERGLERFPFKEDDIRFFRIKEVKKKEFNAVVICMMDTSASMDETRKYLARSFYFLMYQFIRMRYINVEVVFIAHSTVGKVVTEREFFHKVESGGTYISSGYKTALEVIQERYSPAHWNIYSFHVSDGENWSDDDERAVQYAKELCSHSNLFGYVEIMPSYYSGTIKKKFISKIQENNFAIATIGKKEDVWTAFKSILKTDMKEGW